MRDDPLRQLRAWISFYDELGLTPFFRRAPVARTRPEVGSHRGVKVAAPAPERAPAVAGIFPRSEGSKTASLFEEPLGRVAEDSLERIQADIGPDCRRCKLCEQRTTIVFGEGNPAADLVFVGEGPGADEDAQGRPFVGRAGQLLTRWIEKIGFRRADVYICNVVKCRPPGNRAPEKEEVETCSPFLFRQLDVIRPKLICSLGSSASKTLLGKSVSISKIRGQTFDFRGLKLFAMYHPAYLLRPHSPQVDREVQQDLSTIRDLLRG